jgi:hypothetical protein
MYTEFKMDNKRIVVCNNKLNLYKTRLSRKKKCKYKKQKMENEQVEVEMNLGKKKMLWKRF